MNKFIKVLIFSTFVALSSSQKCTNPALMTTFKIADYANSGGVWYTISGKATMNTPLTAGCSKGTFANNGSNFKNKSKLK